MSNTSGFSTYRPMTARFEGGYVGGGFSTRSVMRTTSSVVGGLDGGGAVEVDRGGVDLEQRHDGGSRPALVVLGEHA